MEHTKEPWAHRNGRIYQADYNVLTIANIARAFDGDYSEANARRIVACVNKFAGMSTEEIEALPANVPMLLKRLSERSLQVDQLQEVCAEAYQFAGAYDAPVEVLDNLHAAANGLPLPHESFLPIDDSELVKQRDQLLEALERIADPRLSPSSGDPVVLRDIAKAAIAAVKGNQQ